MTLPRSVGFAHWHSHVNGVNAPHGMHHWLTDRASLTAKLVAASGHFRVQRLRQRIGLCLADEFGMIGIPRRLRVRQREVLLQCDGRAAVFAHTIVPLDATASDWPFFNTLGERSLGTTLFGDPRVERGALQFARIRAAHPLAWRAVEAATIREADYPLFARRSLFRRQHGVMLVTEIFLPAISQIDWKATVPIL